MIALPRITVPPRITGLAFQGASLGFAAAIAAMSAYVIFAHLSGDPGPESAQDTLGGMVNVTGINLFSDRLDAPTGLIIVTGARYENVQAVTDARPSRAWCYTTIGTREAHASTHVNLAAQIEDGAPEYYDLRQIPASMLIGRRVSASSLEAAAQRSCAFPNTATTPQQS
jgi:hypothetical protein